MQPYIDINRHFRDLTKDELEAPDLLASLNDDTYLEASDWSDILMCPRVVLLAEAGSGKTAEMQHQANKLATKGKYAFFIAVESLDQDDLCNLLSEDDENLLNAWKSDVNTTAWFFLDAVDELKLTQGKLDRALTRFAKNINRQLNRANIIISCRPNDWRPNLDMYVVLQKLPFKIPSLKTNHLPGDLFLKALKKDKKTQQDDEIDSPVSQRTVILLPMSNRQIELFSRGLGVDDTELFLEKINNQNAWIFARRPLDCTELISNWMNTGKLGTRAEQHESNITFKLKDNPDRPDVDVLSESKARLGSERLALALALTRTRTIKSPEQSSTIEQADAVLNPSIILSDWSEGERQSLLRRALFDPATYGRIRFHHRSVQEYLAACRLASLRKKGMPIKSMRRLFFAEKYGVKVVIPSMQAVASWLALSDDNISREISNHPQSGWYDESPWKGLLL